MSVNISKEKMQHGNWSGSSSITRKLKGDWWKAKLCTACVSPLGRILSRGGHCPQCGLRVCKSCRYYVNEASLNQENVSAGNSGSAHPNWICVLCSGSAPNGPSASLPKRALGKAGAKAIRRSWTISNPQRGPDLENDSPVLKSFVMYNDDTVIGLNTRQFNSLPRLTYGIKAQDMFTRAEGAGDRRFSYSTLYPFKNNKTNSTSSVNFIEDPFWDYYDYNIINSNRSSCERSLGDVEYCSYIINPTEKGQEGSRTGEKTVQQDNDSSKTLPKPTPPKKPDRPSKRSNSLNSYDGKHLLSFSPLRTYVVLRQPTTAPPPPPTSSGSNKKRSSSFNLDLNSGPKRNRGELDPREVKTPLREYQMNCNQVFNEESQARVFNTAPIVKPKRLFINQEHTPTRSSVIEDVGKGNEKREGFDGSQLTFPLKSKYSYDDQQSRDMSYQDKDRNNLNAIRAELNTMYSSQSLPKRKSKVVLTNSNPLREVSGSVSKSYHPREDLEHQHVRLSRSDSVEEKQSPQSKQAKYFLEHHNNSAPSTPIPKPPRKSIPQPQGFGNNQILSFPDSTSNNNPRIETIIPIVTVTDFVKPEIDPKLQDLLKKSEKILNTTVTTSSLINSPPTIEGNVNIVQINPTQVHTFPRRGKYHSTTVPVHGKDYSTMSSSLDRKSSKKAFKEPTVIIPSPVLSSSSSGELVVEEIVCSSEEDGDDEDVKDHVKEEEEDEEWVALGKEKESSRRSGNSKSNTNQRSHHLEVCEENENHVLLGRGNNLLKKNASKKSQGENADCEVRGYVHTAAQDTATVGGGWVYNHVASEGYQHGSQVFNNTKTLLNEHEENGGGVLLKPIRNESGSRNSNHSNCSSPPSKSNTSSSRLSDLNNRHQYALLTKTRESKSPELTPESDQHYPGSPYPKNLRIIRGRLSNEFVTTVQISNDSSLEPVLNSIVKISDTDSGQVGRSALNEPNKEIISRESAGIVFVPGGEVGEIGAGIRPARRPGQINGKESSVRVLANAREEVDVQQVVVGKKDDREQDYNLCESRVNSSRETQDPRKVSHDPESDRGILNLQSGNNASPNIQHANIQADEATQFQPIQQNLKIKEEVEPPIPLIKSRSPDFSDLRSSTSTEDTTSSADTIIDFLQSQANIDKDCDSNQEFDNEYGNIGSDPDSDSTGEEGSPLCFQHLNNETQEERAPILNHDSKLLSQENTNITSGLAADEVDHVSQIINIPDLGVGEGNNNSDDNISCSNSSTSGIDRQKPPSNPPSVVEIETDSDENPGIIQETLAKSLENLSDISSGPIQNENLLEYLHNLTTNIQRNNLKNKEADEGSNAKQDILSALAEVPELQYNNKCDKKSKEHAEDFTQTFNNSMVNVHIMEHHERLTPEGQESFTDDSSSTTKRSSPDGEAIQDVKLTKLEEDAFHVTSSDSDNSWIEEIPYEEEGPPPLDLTLHTIVEESCEESADESEKSLRLTRKPLDELENYFNYLDPAQNQSINRKLANEDSEFSDTFSESSFNSESHQNQEENSIDPVDLASTRLEKYFTNLGYNNRLPPPTTHHHIPPEQDSEDSVGSESECDDHVQDKKKKVFKHKRSANVSDDESIFDLDEGAYDTIKKSKKKSGQAQHGNGSSNHETTTAAMLNAGNDKEVPKTNGKEDGNDSQSATDGVSPSVKPKQVLLNRSNSFQWSSDEEVNLMMSKLRHLVKNLMQKGHSTPTESNSQLRYFETELIRLMRSEPELKNIVSEYISSEESDDNEFNQFIKEVVNQQHQEGSSQDKNQYPYSSYANSSHDNLAHSSHRQLSNKLPKDVAGVPPTSGNPTSPALIAKVMHHIGNRLSVWMKDEEEEGTLKCAPSVSSDLNEDRFSWKGSFESTLAAKRQSVGSTDSISSSDFNNQLSQAAGSGTGVDRSILRSSSLHHLANSQPIEEKKEEEENISNSLPRLNQVTHMPRAQSLLGIGKEKVKSARYRPPGFSQVPSSIKQMNDKMSVSTPALHQDIDRSPDTPTMNLRSSDSMASMYEPGLSQVNVRGQIEFSLQYNYKLASLEVRVKQCRDLAAVDTKRNRSDPYVKAYLLPDRSKSGKRKTKTKKNTLNPIFEETLKFPLSLSELQNRTLWISVWHSDIFGKNEFLGQVLIPLKDRVFDEPSPVWWQLEEMTDQVDQSPRGDIIIALKWQVRTQSTGNLSILVKEAKNLLPVKNGLPSTFVKCCPLKDYKTNHRSKQKTSIARRTLHPIWNQTLYFEDISDDGVEISLWNYDLLSNHDLVGTIKLDQNVQLWESMLSRHSFWVEGVLKLESEH